MKYITYSPKPYVHEPVYKDKDPNAPVDINPFFSWHYEVIAKNKYIYIAEPMGKFYYSPKKERSYFDKRLGQYYTYIGEI